MSEQGAIERWRELQKALVDTAGSLPEEHFRGQARPGLSPPGWHLEHCVFVECLWIREKLRGDDRITRELTPRSLPEISPKKERGKKIPSPEKLTSWAMETFAQNVEMFLEVRAPNGESEFLGEDRLLHFLISHHAQHLETVRTACVAFKHMQNGTVDFCFRPVRKNKARRVVRRSGEVGGHGPGFFHDNELPRHGIQLPEVWLAEFPVSNAEWWRFVDAGSYEDPTWWSPAGNRWRKAMGEDRAWSWKEKDVDVNAPVHGVTRHEAGAFANWAGGRLPHEYEWETAHEENLLGEVGSVWEWCANPFHPYPGFRPFPYREYSVPWFDGEHFVLKGGSILSEPEVRRSSFRNYFPANTDFITTGLRLAFDSS